MDELASKFSMKTQEAIDRIRRLMSEGILTGVIDDRGKFIYVTMDELNAGNHFLL